MRTDILSDTLTRIRNAQKSTMLFVDCISSNLITAVVKVLHEEGYVDSYEILKDSTGKNEMRIKLKYYSNRPVIHSIDRISKSSVRQYCKISSLEPYRSGLGMYIISTSKGVMSDRKARKMHIGGELLCKVF